MATLIVLISIFPYLIFAFDLDGGWSPWGKLETPCVKGYPPSKNGFGSISSVLAKCNGGVRIRYRSCTMPVPQVNLRGYLHKIMSTKYASKCLVENVRQ